MGPKDFVRLAQRSVLAWLDDDCSSMGAAIAYYTVFSIAPLLLIVIAVAGLVWGRQAVQGEIVAQLAGLIGRQGADTVQAVVQNASHPGGGALAGAVSLVVLVVGATSVFSELQHSLDRIWKAPSQRRSGGLLDVIRSRLISFGLVLGLGFMLSASLVFSTALAALGRWGSGLLPEWELVLQGVNTIVSVLISTLLFAMIFRFMPRARVAWRDVWIGAAVTAVLFDVGKLLIGLYIGKSSVTSSYAAAGSLVVLLLWVYYAAQVFLLGAEFTWVYANDRAGGTAPSRSQPALSPSGAGVAAAVESASEVAARTR